MSDKHPDSELIQALGGVEVLVEKTGYSYTRIKNWEKRGISKDAKVEFPELFLNADILSNSQDAA